jgi:hypothetical protein
MYTSLPPPSSILVRSSFSSLGEMAHNMATVRCLGYVIFEQAQPERIDTTTVFPILERNRAALQSEGIREPRSLIGELQRTRKPITLPDGTVLEPPTLSRPGRKIVVLGDTYDASAIRPLAMGADLLVHECTNVFLPGIDAKPNETEESTREKAKSRGHSTPEVRARFPGKTRASPNCSKSTLRRNRSRALWQKISEPSASCSTTSLRVTEHSGKHLTRETQSFPLR